MRESEYQARLIRKLKRLFPDIYILKTDPEYIQGFPDLLLLWREHWAALEVKASASSPERPNQGFYILDLDAHSFAAFIYPENEKEVLDALQQSFGVSRSTRVSKR